MNAPPQLSPDLLAQCHERQDSRQWARLVIFILLYGGSTTLAVGLASAIMAWWDWLALLPLSVLAAAALHGISLFTHEAVHGTLSANRWWNAILGAVCALPVLQNFSAYRVLHRRHHQHLGEEGDPDHYANYSMPMMRSGARDQS